MAHPVRNVYRRRRDSLFVLPDELLESILLKLDLPELLTLKASTDYFRRLIRSNQFRRQFNRRANSLSWTLVHKVNEEGPPVGRLVLIRDSDKRQFGLPLETVLPDGLNEDGEVSLLACFGSVVLLRYIPFEEDLPCLLLLNLSNTNQVIKVDLQSLDGFNMHFNFQHHVNFQITNPHWARFIIKINYVGLGADFVPRYCIYQSVDGQYAWDIQSANRLDDEILPSFNSEAGDMLIKYDDSTFVVKLGLNVPIYKSLTVDAQELHNRAPVLETAVLGLEYLFLQAQDGWESFGREYHGNNGWVLYMITQMNPYSLGLLRLHSMHLFRLKDDASIYQHISSSSVNPLGETLLNFASVCCVRQDGEMVNISFLTFEADGDDEGFNPDRCIRHFPYNIMNNQWEDVRVNTITGVTDADNPLFIPKLTVGRK